MMKEIISQEIICKNIIYLKIATKLQFLDRRQYFL